MGKAIVGRSGRAVVLIESDVVDRQLGVYTIETDREDADEISCDDIVPHELMHVLDVRQGRSPTQYPLTFPGQIAVWYRNS